MKICQYHNRLLRDRSIDILDSNIGRAGLEAQFKAYASFMILTSIFKPVKLYLFLVL